MAGDDDTRSAATIADRPGAIAPPTVPVIDLKPHNIFLTDDDAVWKVLDFGVALLADTTGTLTQGVVHEMPLRPSAFGT